jgi:penicillin G amidase
MIRRSLMGVLVLLLALIGGFYWYLRSSLPRLDGRIAVEGLHGRVTIARDIDGVPLITAGNDADAAFGLGFAHAQDRLFQMELMRRYGAGRLAEIFGEPALATDRQMRVLGLYRLAEAEFPLLAPPVRRGIEAYAGGVNAFLKTHTGALPPEFLLLRFAPQPWRPADSLVWGKLMDLELAGNYRGELLRARLLRHLTPEQLAFLYPEYPKDAPTTLAGLAHLYRHLPLDRMFAALPPRDVVGPIRASNNWVVDGAHSRSGKPLVANDPHLAFRAPGVWYLARLKTPQREIAGATAAGAPFVVVGHNDRIAWGFTNTGSDVEDLFVEKLDPADPGRYLTPAGSAAFATRQERIAVKGAAPVTLTVRETRHGPVLSDALAPDAAPNGYVLSLAATFLTAGDVTAQALWDLDRAGDWNGFRAALESWVGPQQNIVYGDNSGTIGFIAPARVPIREHGDGWLPVPGWTGQYDWTGFIPFAALPQATNPASGHFVSANNKIVPDDFPYFLGRDWDIPNRALRINQLLDYIPQQSPAAAAAMQADTLSLMAKDLLPLMLSAKPSSPAASEALERLRAWDGRMDREQVAPLLFAAWLRALNRVLLADRLGAAFDDYWGMHPDVMKLILTQHQDWCGVNGEAGPEACAGALSAALDQAVARLSERFGTDMKEWRWGRAHEARFRNLFWSNVPVLSRLLATTIPANGGDDTIDRGGTSTASGGDPFSDVHGPTLRMIADLADLDATRFMIAPGQSGNVLSRHYGDLMRSWRDHAYVTFEKPPADGGLVLAPK